MQWEEKQTKKRQICIHLTGIAGVWIFMDIYSEVQIEMDVFLKRKGMVMFGVSSSTMNEQALLF